MKCEDFEQDIYLYSELSITEKDSLNTHLAGCDSCRKLLAAVQQTGILITQAAATKPQPENFSKLTHTILQAVEKEQKQSVSWMSNSAFRFAMASASLVLIVAFMLEASSTTQPVTKHYPVAKTVMLTSTSLAKSYRDKKEQPQPISLYACVKSGECSSVFEKFRKTPL